MKHKEIYLAIGVYILALCITLRYAIFVQVINADQVAEYELYLAAVNSGTWRFVADSIVNSCLMVTLIPAYIQRLTGLDPEMVFKVYPCFLYSLMPVFVYLMARRYFDVGYSLLAAGLVLSQFFFLYYPAVGRVGVAWGFWAGLIWALLARRYIWVLTFGILVIFSHYGNTYIMIASLLLVLGYMVWDKKYRGDIKVLNIVLVVLMVTAGVWHHGVAISSGGYATSFVENTVTLKVPLKQELPETPKIVTEIEPSGDMDNSKSVETVPDTKPGKYKSLFMLEYKESVVQVAFGKTLPYMNTPQKLEFGLSWFIVFLLLLGYVVGVLRKRLSGVHLLLATAMFSMIGLALMIPHISIYYGISRTYFTTMPVLAPCFIMGAQEITGQKKLAGYLLVVSLLVAYALCVSGVIHSWFGIVK